jgi:hypothetical protein
MENAMFKVGDIVAHAGEHHTVDYHVYDVLPSGMHVRWTRGTGEQREAFVPTALYRLYTKKVTPLNWTKPIQWTGLTGLPRPVQLVGKHGDLYVVQTGERIPFFEAFDADGRYAERQQSTWVYISNAPPPPVWPQKRWFVTYTRDGKPRISGMMTEAPALAHKAYIEARAKQYPRTISDIHIQEVTFNGPSRT